MTVGEFIRTLMDNKVNFDAELFIVDDIHKNAWNINFESILCINGEINLLLNKMEDDCY